MVGVGHPWGGGRRSWLWPSVEGGRGVNRGFGRKWIFLFDKKVVKWMFYVYLSNDREQN